MDPNLDQSQNPTAPSQPASPAGTPTMPSASATSSPSMAEAPTPPESAPVTSPQMVAPMASAPSSKKKMIEYIVLGVVIVALIGAGVYYYLNFMQ